MKTKKCEQCGIETEKLYGEGAYCKKCYSEIWDNGFEVTSEWAYDISHRELNESIDENLDNSPAEFIETLTELLNNFNEADWVCTQCDEIRLTKEEQLNNDYEQCIEILLKPCPNCGVKGYLHQYFSGI